MQLKLVQRALLQCTNILLGNELALAYYRRTVTDPRPFYYYTGADPLTNPLSGPGSRRIWALDPKNLVALGPVPMPVPNQGPVRVV